MRRTASARRQGFAEGVRVARWFDDAEGRGGARRTSLKWRQIDETNCVGAAAGVRGGRAGGEVVRRRRGARRRRGGAPHTSLKLRQIDETNCVGAAAGVLCGRMGRAVVRRRGWLPRPRLSLKRRRTEVDIRGTGKRASIELPRRRKRRTFRRTRQLFPSIRVADCGMCPCDGATGRGLGPVLVDA